MSKLPSRLTTNLIFCPKRSIIYYDGIEEFTQHKSEPAHVGREILLPGYEKFRNKTMGVHRDWVMPKLDPTSELLGKKLREMQLRERFLPSGVEVVKGLRKRQPGELLEVLRDNKEVCLVVNKRDEWSEDLHLVAPWKFAWHILRTDSGYCKQYELDVGAEEPIRVIFDNFIQHPWQGFPIKVHFHRFVMGRPNPINLPIYPYNHFASRDHQLGADLSVIIHKMDLWTYTDLYPPRLELDCGDLTVTDPYRIGDIEKLLPEGVFLHKKYMNRKYQSVIKLEETKSYKAKQAIKEQKQKAFEEKKREIELQEAMTRQKVAPKKKVKKKFEKKA